MARKSPGGSLLIFNLTVLSGLNFRPKGKAAGSIIAAAKKRKAMPISH